MKITVTLNVTYETENPDGYPEEFYAIKGRPKTKRERHVFAAHSRAVKLAEEELIKHLEDEDLQVERYVGQVEDE